MDDKSLKIVLTGGPGGGKTTALDLFRRELLDKVSVVPEAASILFRGGLPRSENKDVIKCTQRTIYQLQTSLEQIQSTLYPDKLLVCDRGTVDGFAYWPSDDPDEFFKHMNTTMEKELKRYDAVIFFETAASNGNDISSNNPVRTESKKQAIDIDKRLHAIWSKHPNFHYIASSESFVQKVMFGIMTINNVIKKHNA